MCRGYGWRWGRARDWRYGIGWREDRLFQTTDCQYLKNSIPYCWPGSCNAVTNASSGLNLPIPYCLLLGWAFRVTRQRGEIIEVAPFGRIMATVHPSSILRAPDSVTRHREFDRFVEELKRGATASSR